MLYFCKWFWIILATLVVAFIILMSTSTRHVPTEAVEAHTILAQRVEEAPLYSPEYLSAARSIPTEHGRPWYGLCPLDGANTIQTFKRTINQSPRLAATYKDFDWGNARVEVARGDELRHVSYLKGGQLWWSSAPLKLHPGEPLVTDGVIVLRGHCCNQVSPYLPAGGATLPPAHEPSVETFDRAPYVPVPVIPRGETTEVLSRPVWEVALHPPLPLQGSLLPPAYPVSPGILEISPPPFVAVPPPLEGDIIVDVGIPPPPPPPSFVGSVPVPECGTGSYLVITLIAWIGYKAYATTHALRKQRKTL